MIKLVLFLLLLEICLGLPRDRPTLVNHHGIDNPDYDQEEINHAGIVTSRNDSKRIETISEFSRTKPSRQKLVLQTFQEGQPLDGESVDLVELRERILTSQSGLQPPPRKPSYRSGGRNHQNDRVGPTRSTGRKYLDTVDSVEEASNRKYVDPNDENEEPSSVQYEPVKAKAQRLRPHQRTRPNKIGASKAEKSEVDSDIIVNNDAEVKIGSFADKGDNFNRPTEVVAKIIKPTEEYPKVTNVVQTPKVINPSDKVNDPKHKSDESTTSAPQFEAFYPREAYGIPNSPVRAPHGHGSFYKYRNPALVDTKNAAAYGFRFDGKRRFNFDAEGPIEDDFDSEAPISDEEVGSSDSE